MAIKKVWIEEGCIVCNLSGDTCPEVFDVPDTGAVVRPGVDFGPYEDKIREAAEGCPVQVIKFEEA
jgi:ferredoxin